MNTFNKIGHYVMIICCICKQLVLVVLHFCSYVFAKTTVSGLTTFYGLFLNSSEQRVYFEYRPEGLDQGSRTLILDGVNFADGDFHHFAVTVYGANFALYVDGRLHRSRMSLIGALEDGPGVLYIGRRLNHPSRFSGERFHSIRH